MRSTRIFFKRIFNLNLQTLQKERRRLSVTAALRIGDGDVYKCSPCSPELIANTRASCSCKVRHCFIPEEWFTFFYEKTGVTGPYMFAVGLFNYLFSKEIYVCEHEFYSGLSVAILCIVALKKLGPPLAEYLDKEIDKIELDWKNARAEELKQLDDVIQDECKEQWRAEGNLLLMELKKQNINLQLEAAYRKALWNVYEEVKRRLDYQVACANVERRLNQKNMIFWIMKELSKSLPTTDEATKSKFKADLSALVLRLKL